LQKQERYEGYRVKPTGETSEKEKPHFSGSECRIHETIPASKLPTFSIISKQKTTLGSLKSSQNPEILENV
jgi:hypothetical protein